MARVFQRFVIGDFGRGDVAIAIESLHVVAHGGAFDAQGHANRGQQRGLCGFAGERSGGFDGCIHDLRGGGSGAGHGIFGGGRHDCLK